MALPEHIFVVDAEVDPSVEAAWNDWYNEVHLPEITALAPALGRVPGMSPNMTVCATM
jgi:hypothetical protein